MSEIRVGMRAEEFMTKNRQQYESLDKSQQIKIFDFWKQDADKVISNEVEKAILEGFLNDSGVVRMPQGNPKLKVKNTANGEAYKTTSIYTYSKLEVESYEGAQLVRFTGSNGQNGSETEKKIYVDTLIDTNGDGIADERILEIKTLDDENCREVRKGIFRDINMDGRFDEKLGEN